MTYWLIRYNGEVSIVGPFPTWQRACMNQYGHISIDMSIKLLTNETYLLRKQKWVEREIAKDTGWFVPYIPDNNLGITMTGEKALGPKEIGERMLEISNRLKGCQNRTDAAACFQEATPYLRFIPMPAASKFSEFYNGFMKTLPPEDVDNVCPIG